MAILDSIIRKYLLPVVAVTAAVALSSCSTVVNAHRQKLGMMGDYLSGQTPAAYALAADKADNGGTDEVMWHLEAGQLSFAAGRYQQGLEHLERAEELIADYDERAVVSLRDATSESSVLFTNLNALPYRGLCRDRMMLQVLKAFSYLGLARYDSFFAQVRRLRGIHSELLSRYENEIAEEEEALNQARSKYRDEVNQAQRNNLATVYDDQRNQQLRASYEQLQRSAMHGYSNFLNPLATFLSGLAGIYDNRNYSVARIEFQRLWQAMPTNPLAAQYYVTALKRTGSSIPADLQSVKPFDFPLERGCVFVILANGITAALEQDLIYYPVAAAWPRYIAWERPFATVEVHGGGVTAQSLPLADMDAIFAAEFRRRLPGMIVRTVLSTAVKEAIYYATIHAIDLSDADTNAKIIAKFSALTALTAYRVAMNTADTRTWETLPAEYQLAQLPLPKDRRINVTLGGVSQWLDIPEGAPSAILFINAPSQHNVSFHVLPLRHFQ